MVTTFQHIGHSLSAANHFPEPFFPPFEAQVAGDASSCLGSFRQGIAVTRCIPSAVPRTSPFENFIPSSLATIAFSAQCTCMTVKRL